MKKTSTILLIATSMLMPVSASFAADGAEIWNKSCAMCHAKDGSGNTAMGKKIGAKNYTDAAVQSALSDAAAIKAIKEGVNQGGKEVMKPFKDKLTDADAQSVLAYMRSFKK